jgi:hypothetical protein
MYAESDETQAPEQRNPGSARRRNVRACDQIRVRISSQPEQLSVAVGSTPPTSALWTHIWSGGGR